MYKYVILNLETRRVYGTINGGAFPDLETAERRKGRLAHTIPVTDLMICPILATNIKGPKAA